ncbi:MAG: 3-oxoacyl-[acyl-carrier protein] reductase [Frankiaceae bacterium]|jgi:NAD(P)-dependent dehydrogenase (short-subunit alcohol dehydrogenase family)|nr:3-oxoacyl-[acyl-carrier protein] reductase [Frankiaceae bacterium]
MSLDGRVALVTGGGRGLGRALALALAEDGAAVAVGARSVHEVDAVAGELREAGRSALAVSLDVADPASVADAVRRVEAELGGVDVLVNSAGVVWPVGLLHKVDVEEWEQSIAINLVGAARCVRAVLPGMLERGWGRIVNLSSGAAVGSGMPSSSAYSVGKAGLDMLTANLGDELDGTGVQIVGVRPGVVDTSMQDYMRSLPREQVGEVFYEKFHGMHERGELIGPEPAIALVLGLLDSERTGETWDVRDEKAEQLARAGK